MKATSRSKFGKKLGIQRHGSTVPVGKDWHGFGRMCYSSPISALFII